MRITAAAVLLVAGSLVSTIAQTARIDAMGGCFNLPDMSSIMIKPADISLYKDAVGVTFDGSVGPALGVKSMGSVFSAGLWHSGAQALAPSSYTFLLAQLNASLGATPAPIRVDPIPHVVLGLDFASVDIGLDLFFERSFYHFKSTDVVAGTPAVTTQTTVDGSFINPGFLAGVNLGPHAVPVSISLGLSLPRVSGNRVAGATTQSATSESGLDANGLVEASVRMAGLRWTGGVGLEYLAYQASASQTVGGAATTTTTPKNKQTDLDVYIGVERNLADRGITIAVLENTTLSFPRTTTGTPTAVRPDTGDNVLIFQFGAGIEKKWTGLKWFDAVETRGGLTYGVGTVGNHANGEAAGASHSLSRRNPTGRTGVGLTLGAGLTKNSFQFDLQVAPLALLNAFKFVNGTYNTPAGVADMVKFTATLDLGRNRSAAPAEATPVGS